LQNGHVQSLLAAMPPGASKANAPAATAVALLSTARSIVRMSLGTMATMTMSWWQWQLNTSRSMCLPQSWQLAVIIPWSGKQSAGASQISGFSTHRWMGMVAAWFELQCRPAGCLQSSHEHITGMVVPSGGMVSNVELTLQLAGQRD
jgi:hypothetical protein